MALKRVLIADDDPEVLRLMVSALASTGLVVDLAQDGQEALSLLRQHSYSVILLDLLMPAADGFDVLQVIRAETLSSPPVVLVLTGAEREVTKGLDARRIHGVIRKPFDPHELASLIVACSDIKGRGAFGPMAIATIVSGAPFLAWLVRS